MNWLASRLQYAESQAGQVVYEALGAYQENCRRVLILFPYCSPIKDQRLLTPILIDRIGQSVYPKDSGRLVKDLAYAVNVVANGGVFLLLIIQEVNRIKEIQIIYLATDGKQQIVVDVVSYKGKVNIRTGAIIAL